MNLVRAPWRQKSGAEDAQYRLPQRKFGSYPHFDENGGGAYIVGKPVRSELVFQDCLGRKEGGWTYPKLKKECSSTAYGLPLEEPEPCAAGESKEEPESQGCLGRDEGDSTLLPARGFPEQLLAKQPDTEIHDPFEDAPGEGSSTEFLGDDAESAPSTDSGNVPVELLYTSPDGGDVTAESQPIFRKKRALRVLDADARHVRRRVRAGRCADARANARAEVHARAVPQRAQVVREVPAQSPCGSEYITFPPACPLAMRAYPLKSRAFEGSELHATRARACASAQDDNAALCVAQAIPLVGQANSLPDGASRAIAGQNSFQ